MRHRRLPARGARLSSRKHHKLDKAQKRFLKSEQLRGVELVDSVARLCAMNLLLHGIGERVGRERLPVAGQGRARRQARRIRHGADQSALRQEEQRDHRQRGGRDEQRSLIINRDDFWATTSNKQLNFLQHVFTILKQHGRAAVVVPDNVLFEGGAGETIRRELLKQADVHTLLRLPTGIFYAQGVKANVLFFDRKPAAEKQPWTTEALDLRPADQPALHPQGKPAQARRPRRLRRLLQSQEPPRAESERFKSFTYEELLKRDKVNLDIFWLKDESLEDSANLPDPESSRSKSPKIWRPRWSSSRRSRRI